MKYTFRIFVFITFINKIKKMAQRNKCKRAEEKHYKNFIKTTIIRLWKSDYGLQIRKVLSIESS